MFIITLTESNPFFLTHSVCHSRSALHYQLVDLFQVQSLILKERNNSLENDFTSCTPLQGQQKSLPDSLCKLECRNSLTMNKHMGIIQYRLQLFLNTYVFNIYFSLFLRVEHNILKQVLFLAVESSGVQQYVVYLTATAAQL